MELVIAAAVLALGLVAAARLYGRGRLATANGGQPTARAVDVPRKEAAPTADQQANAVETQRIRTLEVELERREEELEERERDLDAQVARLAREEEELAQLREDHTRALERAAGGEAKLFDVGLVLLVFEALAFTDRRAAS